MAWWNRKPKAQEGGASAEQNGASSRIKPNPMANHAPASERAKRFTVAMGSGESSQFRDFFSNDVNRTLFGWDTQSATIDFYLANELRSMRARSRSMVRMNPYGKKFIQTLKANVIGPVGVTMQAQVMKSEKLDTPVNEAIERLWAEWCDRHCDARGHRNFTDIQNLLMATAAQDGEFLVRLTDAGPHKFSLEVIDPEMLNVQKNHKTSSGGEIRLGVEYDAQGNRVRYWLKKPTNISAGGYDSGQDYTLDAKGVIHGYIHEWPDQSRGVPWMHASLERSKHLEKYEESAIVKARSTAATMAVVKTPDGQAAYTGDEQVNDELTFDEFEAGTIKDIGNRDLVNLDSDYPHTMYQPFVKQHLQGIASGLGISYHSLSSDLEGVNYSSIRAGVLEDREIFKGLQNWFIRCFVRPVYEEWIYRQIAMGRVVLPSGRVASRQPFSTYFPARFQGRRWAWVDPQKDSAANESAINSKLKSRSQIIREQGDDPETVFLEIQREQDRMQALGINIDILDTEALANEQPNED